MRIYLSGPITNMGTIYVTKSFNYWRDIVQYKYPDAEILSPLENGLPINASRAEHMIADIQMIMKCDHIFFLPGFDLSKGCICELICASEFGLTAERADGLPIKVPKILLNYLSHTIPW